MVNVTYTDVHAERLAFFQSRCSSLASFTWGAGRTADFGGRVAKFYLATGHESRRRMTKACRANLEFLASRLVFLIDWNRARKQLRGFSAWGGPDRALVSLGGGDGDRAPRASSSSAAPTLINQRHRGDRGIRPCGSATDCATCSATPRRPLVPAIRIPGRDRWNARRLTPTR